MTDSLERKPEENTKEAIKARMAPYQGKAAKLTPADIPRWVKMAIAKHVILGTTYKDLASEFGKAASTIRNWLDAPGAKIWRDTLQEIADDPVEVARLIIKGSIVEAALDQLWALDAAKRAGDHKEVRLATKDLLQSQQIFQTQASGPTVVPVIQINLGNLDSLEPPEVESSYEVIEPEYNVEDLDEYT